MNLPEREAADQDAAAAIAVFLKTRTAKLPDGSPVRDLARKSAEHWQTIAGNKARRHLALVELERQGLLPEAVTG